MDNFLPNDISVMVLKYLASKGCGSAVSAMVEDMPALKFYVPQKPPEMEQAAYMRLLARPSFTPALEDVLNDYGRAKSMIAEIAEKQEPSKSPIRSSDTIVTQLKQLSSRLDESLNNSRQQLLETTPSLLAIRTSLNDEMEIEEISAPSPVNDNVAGPSTRIRNGQDRVQSMEHKELPLVIYNSLMTNSNLHEKIASVINEEVFDFKNSKSDGAPLRKVCSKMESELNLDKFLNELLRDGTNDFIDIIPPSLMSPGRSRHSNQNSMDGGLTNLFQDADSIISNDVKGQSNNLQTINMEQLQSVAGSCPAGVESKSCILDQQTSISNLSLDSSDTTSPNSSVPSTSKKPSISKKRIVPQPAAPCTKSNPVFETVHELVTTVEGNKYSVTETIPVVPKWQQLGRRSITPKIPSSRVASSTTPPKSVPKLETDTSSAPVIGSSSKRKKLTTPLKRSPEKAFNTEHNFCLVYHDPDKINTSVVSSNGTKSVKPEVTPENEKGNVPVMLPDIKPNCTVNTVKENDKEESEMKEEKISLIPVSEQCKSETPKYIESSNSLKSSISQMIEVTPILDNVDVSEAKGAVTIEECAINISPRLRRLIASAQKARAPTTQINLGKKSFSTPRKKKHVRSLQFTTPPSAKQSGNRIPFSHNDEFDAKLLANKRKLESNEEDKSEEPPNKKVMKSPEDPTVYKSSAFPDRKFTCKYISESVIQSVKKVLQTNVVITDAPDASTKAATDVASKNTDSGSKSDNRRPKKFSALSKITEEESLEASIAKKDKFSNTFPQQNATTEVIETTMTEPKVPSVDLQGTPSSSHSQKSAESFSVNVKSTTTKIENKTTKTENKTSVEKLSQGQDTGGSLPIVPMSLIDVGAHEEIPASPLEDGEYIDSQNSNSELPSPCKLPTKRKSYNDQILDLFGPMTPDNKVASNTKVSSRRNSSNEHAPVIDNDKKSKSRESRESHQELKPRANQSSGQGRKSWGGRENVRVNQSKDPRNRGSGSSYSKHKAVSPPPERKQDPLRPSRVSDRVREKREKEQEEKSRRHTREQELQRTRDEKVSRDDNLSRSAHVREKRRTPKKASVTTVSEQDKKNMTAEQVSKRTKPDKSGYTPPSSDHQKCKTPSRRTKQGIDVAAAKSVANSAIPVNRNTSISPKSPVKDTLMKNRNTSSQHRAPDNIGQVREAVNPVTITLSTASINSAVTETVQATPIKDIFVPFNILPGPVGFPDPTPVKNAFSDVHQGHFSVQSHSLITPMKANITISPPVSIPVTPKIVFQEDTESNSLSAFKSSEGILWTPSKFFGPPLTPGRTIFVDEHSQAACSSELEVMTLHSAAFDQLTGKSTETPLDLSSSPIAPHRTQESLGSDQTSSSSSSESQSGSSTDSQSTSSNDDTKKPDEVHFQIPIGAPKKASPILPLPSKKSKLPVNDAPSVQNTPLSPARSGNQTSSKHGTTHEQNKQDILTDLDSKSKSSRKSTSLPACDTTFLVKGMYKCLSASEHQPVVQLAGTMDKNTVAPDETKQIKESPNSDGTPSPLIQGRSKIRNLLKKVDLNRFLTKVHNRDS